MYVVGVAVNETDADRDSVRKSATGVTLSFFWGVTKMFVKKLTSPQT